MPIDQDSRPCPDCGAPLDLDVESCATHDQHRARLTSLGPQPDHRIDITEHIVRRPAPQGPPGASQAPRVDPSQVEPPPRPADSRRSAAPAPSLLDELLLAVATHKRLRLASASALERAQVGDAEEATAILEAVVRLDGSLVPPEEAGPWTIKEQTGHQPDQEIRLRLASENYPEQELLIIWPADDDPSIHIVPPES